MNLSGIDGRLYIIAFLIICLLTQVVTGASCSNCSTSDGTLLQSEKTLNTTVQDINKTDTSASTSCFSPYGSGSDISGTTTGNNTGSPVIVNIQVNLENDEDLKNIDPILSKIESSNWVTSVYVTGSFASSHPEAVKNIEARGHTIGVFGWSSGEDISVLSFNDQKNQIDRSISAVKSAVRNPKTVVDYKPQNLRYNDDTITILQDFHMRSITATFSSDESFVTCPYAKSLGKVTFPYPVSNDFFAVPLSEGGFTSQKTTASDSQISRTGTDTVNLAALETEFDRHLQTRDPMVIAVSPSASDSLQTTSVLEFIDYANENGGVLKPMAPITLLSTYLSSLAIISSPESAAVGETVSLTVSYSTTLYCPTYYFRTYGKYPQDSGWILLDSQSHYVYTGSHTLSSSFTIPENLNGDTSYQVIVVGRGCKSGFVCWPESDSYEAKDSTTIDINLLPVIEDIEISPDATTTKEVTFTAIVSDAPDYEIFNYQWTETDVNTNNIDFSGEGNPLYSWPDPGTHGKKIIKCVIIYKNRHSGVMGSNESDPKEFNLFFDKYGNDNNNPTPNWFTYWNSVPGVGWPSAMWVHSTRPFIGVEQPGAFLHDGKNTLLISDLASKGTNDLYHRGLSSFDFFNCVIIHEGTHQQNWMTWWPGYNEVMYNRVQPLLDADKDYIPNIVEDVNRNGIYDNPPDPSNWTNRFTTNGVSDNELLAQNAETSVIPGAKKSLDWANPGQQTALVTTALQTINTVTQVESLQPYENYYSDEEYPIVDANPTARFINISRDYGYDSDGNGIFNNLTVVFYFNVTKADLYSIEAAFLSEKNHLLIGNNSSFLAEGEQPLLIHFDGASIGNDRQDGTFTLVSGSIYNQSNYLEDGINGSYITQSYNSKDFQRTESGFIDTFNDYAIDLDGDGFTDRLIIDIAVESTNPGNYRIQGTLYNSNNTRIKTDENITYLDAGINHVILQFDNITIIEQLDNKSYFLKELTLYDQYDKCVDYLDTPDMHLSSEEINFPPPSLSFQNNFHDYGLDKNLDGLYDNLILSVEVNATKTGNYSFIGVLTDYYGSEIIQANNISAVVAGTSNVILIFDGEKITRHETNGSYTLGYLAVLDANSHLIDDATDSYTTAPYNYTQFNTGGIISGRVTDSSGNPVSEANVYISGPVVTSTKTDNNGNYKVTRLDSGDYTVLIEAVNPNLMRGSGTVSVIAGQPSILNTILQSAGSIEGYMKDGNGTGIPDIIVYYSGYETPRFITDVNGHYLIPRLTAGNYEINVDASNTQYSDDLKTVSVVLSQTTHQDFVLQKGGSISGIVVDKNYTPIGSIFVTAEGQILGQTTTNSTGNFVIERLKPGDYMVIAHPSSATGFASNSTNVTVTPGETASVIIVLPVGGIIIGTVTTSSGTPVANAYVYANSTYAYTDYNGNYTIPGLVGGNYILKVTPPSGSNLLSNTSDVSIATGQTVTVNVVLLTGGMIKGTVTTVSGTPVASAYVYANGYYNGTTDINGNYTTPGLVGGDYTVKVSPAYGSLYLDDSAQVSVGLGQIVVHDFTLRLGGTIQGTVRSELGGTVVNAYVSAYGKNRESGYAYTGSNGNFTITRLPTSNYTIDVYPPEDSTLARDSAMMYVESGQIVVYNFTLKQGCTIQGTVTSEQGEPVANAYVMGYNQSKGGNGYNYTNTKGNFSITRLREGNYTVTVTPPEGSILARDSAKIYVETGQVLVHNFTLKLGGTLQGSVTSEQGDPVANAYVYASDQNSVYGYNYTNTKGNFSITRLREGNYTVTVTPPDGSTLARDSAKIYLGAGQVLVHNFTLKVGGTLQGTVKTEQGVPIENAYVYSPATGGGVSTDLNGNFSINKLPVNNNIINVSPPSGSPYLSDSAVVYIEAGQIVVRNFTLKLGGTIKGTVTSAQGIPVANAYVHTFSGGKYAYTDINGNFSINRLTTNNYTIYVDPPEGSSLTKDSARIYVEAGQIVVHNFILQLSEIKPLPGFTNPPTDPDSDGLYEDLNANGFADWDDAVVLFWNTDWIQENEPVPAFDFNHNGFIDWDDAVVLFWEV